MNRINQQKALAEAIHSLKIKQAGELHLLKEQFQHTVESMRPVNLIKNTFRQVAHSPQIRNGLVNNAIGLAFGYLSKKVMVGSSHNPIKRMVGAVLEFTIANFVAKRAADMSPTE